MKIPFYYCDCDNFGDKLNEDLFRLLFKKSIISSTIEESIIMGIGSLLDNILLDKNDKKIIKNPIYIYSTGFGFEEGGFFHNQNIILPEKLKRNVIPIALRGKLTKQRIEKLTNNCVNCTLGDGGLLSYLLVDKSKIKQKYDMGIVPHYADRNDNIWIKILEQNPNSRILDVRKPPIEFLHDLCECKTIMSSAMHPLIASDSLGIPNLWVRISEETTSRYKFEDYYSVYDIKQPVPIDLYSNSEKVNEEFIRANYMININEVEKIQEELLSALNSLPRISDHKLFLRKIFSITDSSLHKIITILGIKIKIKI